LQYEEALSKALQLEEAISSEQWQKAWKVLEVAVKAMKGELHGSVSSLSPPGSATATATTVALNPGATTARATMAALDPGSVIKAPPAPLGQDTVNCPKLERPLSRTSVSELGGLSPHHKEALSTVIMLSEAVNLSVTSSTAVSPDCLSKDLALDSSPLRSTKGVPCNSIASLSSSSDQRLAQNSDSCQEGIPWICTPYLARYSQAWVYTRMCDVGVSMLERDRR
jgi:hypothetical protein